MQSLWSKISSFVHTAKAKVSLVFVKLFGADAAQKFGQASLALLQTAEGKIVTDAVEAVSSLALDGAGKRASAFKQIVSDFEAQGISVGESLINLLIELAVQYLKGSIVPAS